MSKPWPKVRLGEVLRHRKEFITIDGLETYKRARVRLHAKGIVRRDELPGALIKTKKQQVCKAGDFLVAEIDAKVGGFGIVPSELHDAIVSSHYFLFEVDASKLDRCFLGYFISTPEFRDQVAAQGSTNYAAIRPGHVLDYEIPLPALCKQRQIVARLGGVTEKLTQARKLQQEIASQLELLIVSTHLQLAEGRVRKLGDVLELHEEAVPIVRSGSYPQVGVRSFGLGLFAKSAVGGSETTYRNFNRLYRGAVVLSQVKGWEGAIAVCPQALEGLFVSPEYRTFRCRPSECRSEYLGPLVSTKWFWEKFGSATRGVGARRERTRPEQFLSLTFPMPHLTKQELGEPVFSYVSKLQASGQQDTAHQDAILAALLNQVFGES